MSLTPLGGHSPSKGNEWETPVTGDRPNATQHKSQMQSLHLSPAPPRPPLPTLRRRPVSSAVASAPAPAPHFSAPSRAAAVGGTSFYAAGRISSPRHLTAAAAGAGAPASSPPDLSPLSAEAESDPGPLSAEDVAERAKLAQVPFTRGPPTPLMC